ncbi:MAG: NADP-dependent malic enzyme [Phototrophicales bacterium]|nr:NADP-dependent malic enzyme [Phototrophicales bacterium]
MAYTKQEALDYHRKGRPGKIEVTPTKPLTTQHHLTLAYSPGVAEACWEIDRNPLSVYELTAKGNLVAVVSNGTAILGIGDLGPEASKPVMEGKGVLFKRFADVDVFDIEIKARTAEEIIAFCKALEPTVGGINLEDIAAPICFEVEERLKAEMDIPVFHDDQHGTAIISGAALMNACEVTGKKVSDLKVVVTGAGASAIACAKFYVVLGVKRENIVMFDSKGIIWQGRDGVNKYKAEFATKREIRTMEEALVGADVVLGLSVAGAVHPEWIKGMAENPLIFAMANPDPEIKPEDAMAVRPDAIVGTGRSDYPNQINNVLGFPFIFRGALDVYAKSINEEMKMAAAKALAALAHEPIPESVLRAYGLESLEFGRQYLIPMPLDPRVLLWVAPAIAEAAMKSGVARREIDLNKYREMLIARQGHGRTVRNSIIHHAKMGRKIRVVYPEGQNTKIISAAYQVQQEGIAEPILLGFPDVVNKMIADLGLDFHPTIITPLQDEVHHEKFTQAYYEMRQRKGVNLNLARNLIRSRTHFGLMMVNMGEADALVAGVEHSYQEIIRPALQIFHTASHVKHVCGVYLMIVKDRVYLFSDTTVNIEPDATTLAEIAILSADFAKSLEIDPRVAMLSFSNFGDTRHPSSDKVAAAVEIIRKTRPDIAVDGEMQADTAVVADIVEQRYAFSAVKDANVLVFPDLNSANISYKLLSRLSNAEAIGPVLLGLGAPVHVLQMGAEVDDIVAMTAVAVMDAQRRG